MPFIYGTPWYVAMPAIDPSAKAAFDRSITEGPILKAVWKLAWPTMLQNMLAGLQGIIDHTMVGHYVGYVGNAAIGVSWQIFLVVVVFITSLYTGMGVMVARFAGANDVEKVKRVVYQALLTSFFLACVILAPLGYFLGPALLDVVNAAPEVKAEALPYLRIMFVFSLGKLLFFMLGGALRSAGDARTPLRLGVALTLMNLVLNVVLIPGLGPVPALGTRGAAIGTVTAALVTGVYGVIWLFRGRFVVRLSLRDIRRPDLQVIRTLFRFGLPTGLQGVAVNAAGMIMLRFIGALPQSAEAQAAYTVGYTELFSLITWTSVGLMGATAAVAGQNLGAGKPERTIAAVHTATRIGLALAAFIGFWYFWQPVAFYAFFGLDDDPVVLAFGVTLLRFLAISALFITLALVYTGGLQGTGDTRGPMVISIVSQIIVPVGICLAIQAFRDLRATDIWLAIVSGHFTRAVLSVWRFRQGKWAKIKIELH